MRRATAQPTAGQRFHGGPGQSLVVQSSWPMDWQRTRIVWSSSCRSTTTSNSSTIRPPGTRPKSKASGTSRKKAHLELSLRNLPVALAHLLADQAGQVFLGGFLARQGLQPGLEVADMVPLQCHGSSFLKLVPVRLNGFACVGLAGVSAEEGQEVANCLGLSTVQQLVPIH